MNQIKLKTKTRSDLLKLNYLSCTRMYKEYKVMLTAQTAGLQDEELTGDVGRVSPLKNCPELKITNIWNLLHTFTGPNLQKMDKNPTLDQLNVP